MNIEPLRNIGMTDSEIKVYLALLELGQTTTGPIVHKAGITRSKIYDILERLKTKGLVSEIMKEATKHFSAATPESILAYVEKKQADLQEKKEEITQLLPQLQLKEAIATHTKIGEIFVGWKGMQHAFDHFLKELDPDVTWYVFGASTRGKLQKIVEFFAKVHKKREEKNVKTKILYNETARGRYPIQQQSTLVEGRYLEQSTPAAINIYKEKTIILIFGDEPISILIHNKQAAESFVEYFYTMWEIAKK